MASALERTSSPREHWTSQLSQRRQAISADVHARIVSRARSGLTWPKAYMEARMRVGISMPAGHCAMQRLHSEAPI